MVMYKLAVIIRNHPNEDEFLLVKQTPPPKFGDEEYDSFVDSDLWDLPSTQLSSLEGRLNGEIVIEGVESCLDMVDLSKFDLRYAINQVLEEVGFRTCDFGHWTFWKYVEEAEFGPGAPVHTVFIIGRLMQESANLQDVCKWIKERSCMNLLVEVKKNCERVGPMVAVGLLNDSNQCTKWKVPHTLRHQEYPPGITLLPMGSRTARPFLTTNLIVFAPENESGDCEDECFIGKGDALIVDPGCRSQFHEELKEIVAALPRKLVLFVTHHHPDHVDGLSIIQKSNPGAILLAHENTMRRIGKDDWSQGFTAISGDEEILIGGQRLKVIFAPGHTDGHMGLLHVSTNSLIVGDHCVGQGSAILDITSGGNMSEYFQTTYNFLELSPCVLIPLHGRVNMWPKHMLCGYLKNRRSRELSILKAIENGAETLFDLVSETYADVDRGFWIPAASNVRLHVDHLAQQNKLPAGFSIQKFQRTCRMQFFSRWICAYLSSKLQIKYQKVSTARCVIAVAVVGFAVLYSSKNK